MAEPILNHATLQSGGCIVMLKVTFYDLVTGEKAPIDAQIPALCQELHQQFIHAIRVSAFLDQLVPQENHALHHESILGGGDRYDDLLLPFEHLPSLLCPQHSAEKKGSQMCKRLCK